MISLREIAHVRIGDVRELTRAGGGSHGGGGGGGGHAGGGYGGHFGGGYSGGSSSSSGSSSGSFDIVGLLVVVAIIFIAYRILGSNARRGLATGTADVQNPAIDPAGSDRMLAVATGVKELRAADPAFEPETFLQRAEMTYFLINRALQHRDAQALQPYVATPVLAEHAKTIQSLIDSHAKPVQLDLNVRGMHVLDVRQTGDFDAILVHLDLVARNEFVDDRTGAVLSDSREDVPYGTELWFERKIGVKTVASGGVVAQKCPVCGSPLKLDEAGRCTHCNSVLVNGACDWTVSSQADSGFMGPMPDGFLGAQKLDPTRGFALIVASDPTFDEAAFSKRCASAFTSLESAWQARDLTDARGFMSPGLYFSWQTQLEQLRDAHRINVIDGLSLDAIQPVSVTHSPDFDNVMVRVSATCADYEIDETTKNVVFGSRSRSPFTEYWTFQRAAGVRTTGNPGTLEKHCPNCGAPLAVNAIGECNYCSCAVTSGKFDWVLSRIEQAEDVAPG